MKAHVTTPAPTDITQRNDAHCTKAKRVTPPVMNADDPLPKRICHDHLDTRPEPCHDSSVSEGASGTWHTKRNVIFKLNEVHGDFRRAFFEHFRALLGETNDEAYVCRLAEYVRWIQSKYMFVRVERPRGSKNFMLGYVKCDWVFSFAHRFERMRVRLNRVPPTLLTKVEVEENKALRLACVGETDYERARATYRNEFGPPLLVALEAKDEDSVMVMLDGGDDPNEVDGIGRNGLHVAAENGCRLPLFNRILAMIHHVNAVHEDSSCGGETALMYAAFANHLDLVISLMNHPDIDLNVQGRFNRTALHPAVLQNHPAIVAQLLSDERIDCTLKGGFQGHGRTALKVALKKGHDECVKALREHGAPEE
jgi:hypothetical protein